jgi:hypothetical protein
MLELPLWSNITVPIYNIPKRLKRGPVENGRILRDRPTMAAVVIDDNVVKNCSSGWALLVIPHVATNTANWSRESEIA